MSRCANYLSLHIVGLCLLLLCFSQNGAAKDAVLKPGTDTLLIKRLLANAYKHQTDPDTTILLCGAPLKMSIEGNYTSRTIELLGLIAKSYERKSDYRQSLLTNQKALSYAISHTQRAMCFLDIGALYCHINDYALATTYFDSGLIELQKDPRAYDPNVYFVLYNSLAVLNSNFKQDSNMLYYLDKAEDAARYGKLNYKLVVVLCNKSCYYQDHHRLDSALRYMLEAKSIVEKNKLKNSEAEIDQGLGSIYFDSGLYETALVYYKSALDPEKIRYSEEPGTIEIYSSYSIAEILVRLKKYKEAEAVLVPAIKKAASLNITENSTSAYATLIKIYKETGQYKKALEYQDSLMTLKDSVYSIEKATAFNQLQIKYQTAEKDKQLSESQLIIARKNVLVISIGGVLLLLVLISVGVYVQIRHKQKTLERENKIGTLEAAIHGGDNERRRIARELHDGIGGMLSAAMMRFSSMHHENLAITQTAAYNDAMDILREMGDEIRKTAHNLMPEVLLKQSLPEAVRLFCNSIHEKDALKIDFQSYGSFDNLSQGYKLNVYRIIQELVKNAITHSRADRILVQLLQSDDKLIVSVEDNGVGFNVREVKGGVGLNNIRTRVDSMDGHFTLESEPGKGATIIIELELKLEQPISPEEKNIAGDNNPYT